MTRWVSQHLRIIIIIIVALFPNISHPSITPTKNLQLLATPFDVGAKSVITWRIRKNKVLVPKSDLISFEDSLCRQSFSLPTVRTDGSQRWGVTFLISVNWGSVHSCTLPLKPVDIKCAHQLTNKQATLTCAVQLEV